VCVGDIFKGSVFSISLISKNDNYVFINFGDV